MELDQQKAHAMRGAVAAVSAGKALLDFYRDGPEGTRGFEIEDPIAELSDALARALDIEATYLAPLESLAVKDERERNDQLRAAIHKWQSDSGADVT